MTLENEVRYFEALAGDPPEKRPTATKEFRNFKAMAITIRFYEAADRIRHSHRTVRSGTRYTTRHLVKN